MTANQLTTGERSRIKRPFPAFDLNKGLLRNDHFQVSYATNDIPRAKEIFTKRYGIENFGSLQGQMPAGGHIEVAIAWVGNTLYELVSATGPGSDVFASRLPKDEFALMFHHLGFLIYNEADWQTLHDVIERDGFNILSENRTEGFLSHCFVDAPELGHYFEFIYAEPAGLKFFEEVPSN